MRKKLIPLVVVALGVAGVATVLLYGLIADRFGPSQEKAKASAQLVVAARAIDRGKVLEPADLRLADAPCPQPGGKACFAQPEALVGRTALEPLLTGQPMLAGLVTAPETGSSPSASIPVGYRAVTLHAADSSGVIGMLRSGDRVDLQAIDADRAVTGAPLTVQKVWQNVEVLQVLPPDPASVWALRPVVTVLLPPRDAEQVGLSDTTGRIRLVLRNREEDQAVRVSRPVPAPVEAPAASVTAPVTPAPAKTSPLAEAPAIPPAPPGSPYLVRLVSVNPEALEALGAPAGALQPRIDALAKARLETTLAQLEKDKTAQVLAQRPLLAAAAPREIVLDALGQGRAGADSIRLRLRTLANGRLRIEPEARVGAPQGHAARRAEEELAVGRDQAVLVSSLLEHRAGRPVLPGDGGPREPRLVLVITPAP